MEWTTKDLKDMIASCELTFQEECVLKLCLGLHQQPFNSIEIGSLLGTSPRRVREIKMAALRKLRDWPTRRQTPASRIRRLDGFQLLQFRKVN